MNEPEHELYQASTELVTLANCIATRQSADRADLADQLRRSVTGRSL